LVRREKAVPADENGGGRWSLDHLFLDQDGVPTLVEVKRQTDTRIRREVVGQMLDYAANCVYWRVEGLQADFEVTQSQNDVAVALDRPPHRGPESRPAGLFKGDEKTRREAAGIAWDCVIDQPFG
jgi:hypothetical protein